MNIHEIVRQRIAEHMLRRRRGETDQARPVIENTGVAFTEPPAAAAVLRLAAVECQECHSLVLRGSTASHAADHVRVALEAQPPTTFQVGTDSASGALPPSTGVESSDRG